MVQTIIPITLNWNTFTGAFGTLFVLYNNKRDSDKVRSMFMPWIARFGYAGIRNYIIKYCNYLMAEGVMYSANYDVIGYKPQYYDAKYALQHVLEILDEDFAE